MNEKPKIRCEKCKKVAMTAHPVEGILKAKCRYCGGILIIRAVKIDKAAAA